MGAPRSACAAGKADAVAPVTSASGLASRSLPPPTAATNSCAACHAMLTDPKLRAPATQFAHSVHRDERIGCVGCHGGDPRDPTVSAHSSALGFRPHPTHADIPKICGGCHSDAAFIRRINGRLPIGQAAIFALSLHGKLTAAGDPNAPDCSSCHGKHDVSSPSAPLSPVSRANVANVCRGCHSDAARMRPYAIPTTQFDDWKNSVHGRAFAAGDARAPTCTGCHGAHAAAPPDATSAGQACARCHEDEVRLFEESPHSRGFRERGLGQCVACHGNHDVAPATAILVGTGPNATCMKCHGRDDRPRQVADRIATTLRGAGDGASDARAAVARAGEQGLTVDGAAYALDRLATAEARLRAVVHTLDPGRVDAAAADIAKAADETRTLVADAARARRIERRGYYAAIALAGWLLLSLVLMARELDRRRAGGAP